MCLELLQFHCVALLKYVEVKERERCLKESENMDTTKKIERERKK